MVDLSILNPCYSDQRSKSQYTARVIDKLANHFRAFFICVFTGKILIEGPTCYRPLIRKGNSYTYIVSFVGVILVRLTIFMICRKDEHLSAMGFLVITNNEIGFTEASADPCIAPSVHALNDGEFQAITSYCGHGVRHRIISFEDGLNIGFLSIVQNSGGTQGTLYFPP